MADTNTQSPELKAAVAEFFAALDNGKPMEDLAKIIKDNPGILDSKEFMSKTLPDVCKDPENLGLVDLDKTLNLVKQINGMEKSGLITADEAKSFYGAHNPYTGDTIATYAARNAAAAYDKSCLDRAPENNISERGQTAFAKSAQASADVLNQMKDMGIPMDLPNSEGKTVNDIAKFSQMKDADGNSPIISGKPLDRENSASVRENIDENGGLEVGGESKEALKVKVGKEALKVNTKGKKVENPEDEKNEATVEDEDEEKAKHGPHDSTPIKEEDIISYMYREWFLASMSWAINGAVNLACDSVDNLCDDFKKRYRKNEKIREEQREKNRDDFSKAGKKFLFNGAQEHTSEYREQSNNTDAYWNDLYENLGKNPPKYKVLNPDNPEHKVFLDAINKEYQKDPQACKHKLGSVIKNREEFKKLDSSLERLASEMVALEIMKEQMTSGKIKRGATLTQLIHNMSDKKRKEMFDKKIIKKKEDLLKNVSNLGVYAELKARESGITDPKEIEQYKANSLASLLKVSTNAVVSCKQEFVNCLDKQEYKYANGELSKEAKDAYKAVQKITKIDDIGGKWLEQLSTKVGSVEQMDIQQAAIERSQKSPIEKMSDTLALDKSAHDYASQKHAEREAVFFDYLQNKDVQKTLSNKNKTINQIIGQKKNQRD